MARPISKPIRQDSASERAFQTVRDAILSGSLLPGAALRELHLARDLGVSQAVVREALIQLETAGLVVRVPNSRTTVTSLTKQDVDERIAVRRCLEEFATVEAMRAPKPDIDALANAVDAIAEAAARPNPFELAQADLEFHRRVWALAGNDVLCRTLEQTTAPLFATVGLIRSEGQPRDAKSAIAAHLRLLNVIRSGRVDDARRAVRLHIETGQEEFLHSRIVA